MPSSSKVRAVCTSSARTDLRGGRAARLVPTATGETSPRRGTDPSYRRARAHGFGDAVVVRLRKRDLLFWAQRLTSMLDERRIAVLIWQHGIGKRKEGETAAKLVSAFLIKTEESTLGRILVETVILHSMQNQTDAGRIIRFSARPLRPTK